MKKTKRILYIILVVVVATVLTICPMVSASADTTAVRDNDYDDIYGTYDDYSFTSPFEGYDYYFIINSYYKYDVVFINTLAWDNMKNSYSNGLQFYTNPSSNSYDVKCLLSPGHAVCTVTFSDLEEHLPNRTHLEAISYLLLTGYITKCDYVTVVEPETGFYTYNYYLNTDNFNSTSSAPYVIKYHPIVAGNMVVSWPVAISTGSVSTFYNQTFSPENGLYDVFRENTIYEKGKKNGNILGYNEGYETGLEQNMADVTGFSVITGALTSVMEVLNMKVFGYFSLGDVISVALVFGVVFFVFKLIRG